MPSEPVNQREFTRVRVEVRVRVQAGTAGCSGLVRSVSMNGMAVQTEERLPLGTECDLTLVLAEGQAEIVLSGRVVDHRPDGMAFQFTKVVGLESFEHLRNLVVYNTSEIEQVEREFSAHAGIRKRV